MQMKMHLVWDFALGPNAEGEGMVDGAKVGESGRQNDKNQAMAHTTVQEDIECQQPIIITTN